MFITRAPSYCLHISASTKANKGLKFLLELRHFISTSAWGHSSQDNTPSGDAARKGYSVCIHKPGTSNLHDWWLCLCAFINWSLATASKHCPNRICTGGLLWSHAGPFNKATAVLVPLVLWHMILNEEHVRSFCCMICQLALVAWPHVADSMRAFSSSEYLIKSESSSKQLLSENPSVLQVWNERKISKLFWGIMTGIFSITWVLWGRLSYASSMQASGWCFFTASMKAAADGIAISWTVSSSDWHSSSALSKFILSSLTLTASVLGTAFNSLWQEPDVTLVVALSSWKLRISKSVAATCRQQPSILKADILHGGKLISIPRQQCRLAYRRYGWANVSSSYIAVWLVDIYHNIEYIQCIILAHIVIIFTTGHVTLGHYRDHNPGLPYNL